MYTIYSCKLMVLGLVHLLGAAVITDISKAEKKALHFAGGLVTEALTRPELTDPHRRHANAGLLGRALYQSASSLLRLASHALLQPGPDGSKSMHQLATKGIGLLDVLLARYPEHEDALFLKASAQQRCVSARATHTQQ